MSKRRSRPLRFAPVDTLLDGRAEATLDLHGCYGSEAEPMVRDFILSGSRRYQGKIIHIITGKGRRSPNGPVLKPLVKRMLNAELRSFIADWALDLDEAGYRVRLK